LRSCSHELREEQLRVLAELWPMRDPTLPVATWPEERFPVAQTPLYVVEEMEKQVLERTTHARLVRLRFQRIAWLVRFSCV
jgi:aminoglycoside phosphotransferase (APT) family kinase protein